MAPPLPSSMAHRRDKKPRRTKQHVQNSLILIVVLCVASLAWLSTMALPSTSHGKDPEILARLKEFSGKRNLSMNNSDSVGPKHVTVQQPLQKQPEKKVEPVATDGKPSQEAAKTPEEESTAKDTINTLVATSRRENEEKEVPQDKQTEVNTEENVDKIEKVESDPKKNTDTTAERNVAKIEEVKSDPNKKSTLIAVAQNATNAKIFVKKLKKVKCDSPSRKGGKIEIAYKAHVNSTRGQVYATSRKAKLTLGNGDLIPALDVALLKLCAGDRRKLTIPSNLAYGKDTDEKFKIPIGSKAVWVVDVVHVGEDVGDDDDDDIEDGEGIQPEKETKPIPLSIEDKWKQAIGLIKNEDPEATTDGTNTAHATNATAMPVQPFGHTMLPLHPAVPYLGVLVDGGRHYFPLDWLKALVDQLHLLRYNFIHLRLTDDQSFNIKLKSHPELAVPAPATNEDSQSKNPVWIPSEMRELVDYADRKNITIMPEINAPGHCASWGGIPGLIIPCPLFSCDKGYGVPLNETNPKLMEVLSDVIKEVTEIFHNSPYLHLGGDEVHMSRACYEEIGETMPDYNFFEVELQKVLQNLGISEDRVVRWETTGQKGIKGRAGGITQWWESFPRGRRKEGEFFVSQGLYFDSCGERPAEEFFTHTQKLVREQPKAIIAGTFELSTQWWRDRNVFGRLLAVAMGASIEGQNLEWSNDMYVYFCESQGWPDEVCRASGRPLIPTSRWLQKWKQHWVTWKAATCERLTEEFELRVMKALAINEHGDSVFQSEREINGASDQFWQNFGEVGRSPLRNETNGTNHTSHDPLLHIVVPHLGATLDPATMPDLHSTEDTLNILAKLGFNLVHLRLVGDSTFPLVLDSHPGIAWDGSLKEVQSKRRYNQKIWTMSRNDVMSMDDIRMIVELADLRNIKVMPEISVASRAGGWLSSGLVAQCPNVLCETDYGLPLDITNAPLLSVLSNVIFELRNIFTSEFLHLGYDERQESKACFDELEISPDFDLFEKKLMALLMLQGIPPEHVLRWESSDSTQKVHRAGNVTHYHTLASPPRNETKPSFFESWTGRKEKPVDPFFVSTGLGFDAVDNATDAWSIYRYTRNLVKAKPTGILVKYPEANAESWEDQNVIGKMIAVAIGASDMPKLDEDNFREVYMKTCNNLQSNLTNCELFGKANSNTLSLKAPVADKRVLESRCESLTQVETRRRPRKGIVEVRTKSTDTTTKAKAAFGFQH